jgi:hypothetical protein
VVESEDEDAAREGPMRNQRHPGLGAGVVGTMARLQQQPLGRDGGEGEVRAGEAWVDDT